MNARRILIILIIGLFSLAVSAPSTWAGTAQQHRIEGIAIGIGALVIATAILDAHHSGHHAEARVAATYVPPVHQRPHGRYENQRVWVPATYQNVWTPGHHGHHGRWIAGHWTRVKTHPGYWSTQQVTVKRR